MIRPFLYLLGYCVMSVSEARCADLVNALSRAGIVYHVIGSYNDSDGSRRIRLRVTPFSAMRISVLCESIGIEIRIDQKAGLPGSLLSMHGVCRFVRCARALREASQSSRAQRWPN